MRITALLIVAFAFATSARASVSINNGNFFIGYTDISYSGGIEPKIERVYNSKSSYVGWFGFGWGSDYEAYIDLSGDGSVVLHENGGGAFNVFAQTGHPTDAEIRAEIDQMVVASKLKDVEIPPYRRRMLDDARHRAEEWARLAQEHKVTPPAIAEGTTLVSDKFGHQEIVKTKDGFRRTTGGQTSVFDGMGFLVELRDANGHSLVLTRDIAHRERATTIADDLHRVIRLTYTKRGRVASVSAASDGVHFTKSAQYRYDQNDELTYSKDSDGNSYEFHYDKRGRRNLVEIDYSDQTSLLVSYHSVDMGEQVASVRDRDKSVTAYSFFTDPLDEHHDITAVETSDETGAMISTTRYEYFRAVSPSGASITTRLITDVDGDRTDTTNDTACGLPQRIDRNGEVTSFEYDKQCHVTLKDTTTETTRLAYDQKAGKVSRVDKKPKGSGAPTWATYEYDAHSNLSRAQNSDGHELSIDYDTNGQIAVLHLIKPNAVTLRFTYNQAARPTVIAIDGVGELRVTYNANGDIEKSDGNREVALKVTTTFQELTDIIRPAGVTLSF